MKQVMIMIMCAEVKEVEKDRLLVKDMASEQDVVVNTSCPDFEPGDKIRIFYNGMMTMSLPPQISAERIIRIHDDNAGPYLIKYNEILETMISQMCGASLTESISANFIVQMIPHHRAAIKMSENILEYTKLSELSAIAEGIISEQTKSIQNMEDALENCSGTNCRGDVRAYQNNVQRITGLMFSEMRNAYSDSCVSCDFIREMIPHHEGAVRMSRNALRYNICPELKPILNAIISSQERGIRQMRCLSMKLKCGSGR